MNRVIALLLLALMSQAANALPWEQLGDTEQQVLQPYAERWDSMSPEQQLRLQKGARRWAGMSGEERKQTRERFRRWQALSDEQKQRIRERYQQFMKMEPEQQQRIRQRMQQFNQLPQERREALRQRWQSAKQEQQRPQMKPPGPTDEAEETPPVQENAEVETHHMEKLPQQPVMSPQQPFNRGGGYRIDRQGMERIPRGDRR